MNEILNHDVTSNTHFAKSNTQTIAFISNVVLRAMMCFLSLQSEWIEEVHIIVLV